MGCPIRGVILDPIIAMQMGIQGQVQTLTHGFLEVLSFFPNLYWFWANFLVVLYSW